MIFNAQSRVISSQTSVLCHILLFKVEINVMSWSTRRSSAEAIHYLLGSVSNVCRVCGRKNR